MDLFGSIEERGGILMKMRGGRGRGDFLIIYMFGLKNGRGGILIANMCIHKCFRNYLCNHALSSSS
jgi:hypothetical protein